MQYPKYRSRLGRCACIALLAWGFSALAAPGETMILSKTEVEFPREAVLAGADKGRVKARLTIDRSGEVTRVEILEADPRRVFDRAVTKSLSQWRFNAGNDGRLYEIDIDFKR